MKHIIYSTIIFLFSISARSQVFKNSIFTPTTFESETTSSSQEFIHSAKGRVNLWKLLYEIIVKMFKVPGRDFINDVYKYFVPATGKTRFSISKKVTFFLLPLFIALSAQAQKNKQLSIAFINAQTAYPFSQFGNLVTGIEHPGIEIGYCFNWKTKTRHDWYQEIKFGYFYHRYVQHAFTLYTDVGYRYKFSPKWTAQIAVGAGYLHSVPATAKLKLDNDGEYKNNKGIGRAQILGLLNFGVEYTLHPSGARPLKIFTTYQQFFQTPFVKAYVPLLPYNSLSIGFSIPLRSHKN